MSFSASLDSDYLVRVVAVSLLNHLDHCNQHDVDYASRLSMSLLQQCAGKEFNTVAKKNVFPNTLLHRRKFRALQGCLVVWPTLLKSARVHEELRQVLWLNVEQESMPSSRSIMEWMLASGYAHSAFDHASLWERLSRYHGNAAVSISVLTVAFLVAKSIKSDDFLAEFFKVSLPYFIHNNHAVRMHIVFIWQQLANAAMDEHYEHLSRFIGESEQCRKFVEKLSHEHMLHDFDPQLDLNLQFIYSELPRRCGMAVDECIAFPSFQTVDPSPGSIPFQSPRSLRSFDPADPVGKGSASSDLVSLDKGFQQKIVPIELAQAQHDLQGAQRAAAMQERIALGQLIILASYVDKIPNLAGLSRTCEVLGATKLCVANGSLVDSVDFQAIAMTSDRWLDIEEVTLEDVESFIERKRCEGFRIIAIEQSSSSVSLVDYQFPKDCLLVLGNEREGVPARILHLVDDCLEIPQFGMVRSLNVHVTGSIVLWEARKQMLSRQ